MQKGTYCAAALLFGREEACLEAEQVEAFGGAGEGGVEPPQIVAVDAHVGRKKTLDARLIRRLLFSRLMMEN